MAISVKLRQAYWALQDWWSFEHTLDRMRRTGDFVYLPYSMWDFVHKLDDRYTKIGAHMFILRKDNNHKLQAKRGWAHGSEHLYGQILRRYRFKFPVVAKTCQFNTEDYICDDEWYGFKGDDSG